MADGIMVGARARAVNHMVKGDTERTEGQTFSSTDNPHRANVGPMRSSTFPLRAVTLVTLQTLPGHHFLKALLFLTSHTNPGEHTQARDKPPRLAPAQPTSHRRNRKLAVSEAAKLQTK